MKPVQVQIISVLKAYRNHAARMGLARPPAATSFVGHHPANKDELLKPPQLPIPFKHNFSSSSSLGLSNPCLDLFFKYPVDADKMILASPEYHEQLTQLLPLSWSHNPLTTLKIICNLLDRRTSTGKSDKEAFYTAAIWLHHNHPKTLACNLLPIAGSFAKLTVLVDLLYFLVEGRAPVGRQRRMLQQDKRETRVMKAVDSNKGKAKPKASALLKRRKMITMAKKTAERYHQDPHYQLLHDRVADLFAYCLKYDIEKLQQHHHHNDYCLEITDGAWWFPSFNSSIPRSTDLLCESISKKVFPPRESGACCVDRLSNEVLVPLRKVLKPAGFKREPFVVDKYMEEVKVGGKSNIQADALLPHHVIYYVIKVGGDLGQVAELQWKRMVEDIYLKQGKLKNCLAVCDILSSSGCGFGPPSSPYRVSVAMGILVSQLSEEPWKGKVMFYSSKPQLHLIQGDDLKSKCEFMTRMKDSLEWEDDPMDLRKVFDLILEVAMNGNLKPEQMIKRVFLFNTFNSPDIFIRWEADYYGEIRRKFKENGYGDVVPHLVCWNLCKPTDVPRCIKPGMNVLSNFSDNLLKSFLDNDGEIGPDHVMEAAISGQGYQSLAVVD